MTHRGFEVYFVGETLEEAVKDGALWEHEEGAMEHAHDEGLHVFTVRVMALSTDGKHTYDGVADKMV